MECGSSVRQNAPVAGATAARRAAGVRSKAPKPLRGWPALYRTLKKKKGLKFRATSLESNGLLSAQQTQTLVAPGKQDDVYNIGFQGVHHIGLLCENLERSLAFYENVLGLKINPDRPHNKLPYRGAWLWIGPEMIHLMELPDPDPKEGRPTHGGRDRHFCVGVTSIDPLVERLKTSNIEFTMSMSGRPAVFFRDPDMNCLECVEMKAWR